MAVIKNKNIFKNIFKRAWAFPAAMIALVLALALPILGYPLGRDQATFGVVGWGLLQGQSLYKGYWDFKPPAIYLIFAEVIRVLGQTPVALRALDLIAWPVMGACLYWLARRLVGRRLSLLAVLAFGAFYFTESFWTLTQNDGLAMLPLLLAAVCAVKAADGRIGWAIVSGLWVGVAFWFKYTFVLIGPALVIGYAITVWQAGGERRIARIARGIVAVGAGGLVVLLGGVALLAAAGILPETIQTIQLASQYTGLSYNNIQWYQSPVWLAGVQERIDHWGLLLIMAGLWFVVRLRLPGRASPAADQDQPKKAGWWWLVWLWALLMLVNVLWQAKGISYQWLPILPPLILIGAGTIDKGLAWFARWFKQPAHNQWLRLLVSGGLAAALVAGLVNVVWLPALPFWSGQETQLQYYGNFRGGEFVADDSQVIADYLKARVAPGDTLYIWGFRPEIYYLADLRPATPFISQFPLVGSWYPFEWKQKNVDILWAAMPPYALVLKGDNIPWVTGIDEASNVMLQDYTELNNWLEANYTRETTLRNFEIWKRIKPPG